MVTVIIFLASLNCLSLHSWCKSLKILFKYEPSSYKMFIVLGSQVSHLHYMKLVDLFHQIDYDFCLLETVMVHLQYSVHPVTHVTSEEVPHE